MKKAFMLWCAMIAMGGVVMLPIAQAQTATTSTSTPLSNVGECLSISFSLQDTSGLSKVLSCFQQKVQEIISGIKNLTGTTGSGLSIPNIGSFATGTKFMDGAMVMPGWFSTSTAGGWQFFPTSTASGWNFGSSTIPGWGNSTSSMGMGNFYFPNFGSSTISGWGNSTSSMGNFYFPNFGSSTIPGWGNASSSMGMGNFYFPNFGSSTSGFSIPGFGSGSGLGGLIPGMSSSSSGLGGLIPGFGSGSGIGSMIPGLGSGSGLGGLIPSFGSGSGIFGGLSSSTIPWGAFSSSTIPGWGTTSSSTSGYYQGCFSGIMSPGGNSLVQCPQGEWQPMSFGSQGDAVKGVQDILKNQGLFNASSTGFFGSITQDAVKNFQQMNGLGTSGMVDTQTFSKLTDTLKGILNF